VREREQRGKPATTSRIFFERQGGLQTALDDVRLCAVEPTPMTMPSSTQQAVTELLGQWSNGDEGAFEKLFPVLHPELHRLAHHYMSRERAGHTLQTTAILNEAYLQLVDSSVPVWQGRTHFIAAAAQIMRHIMVDHARKHQSFKRGGGALKVTLDEGAVVANTRPQELLDLDEALQRLAAQDARKSQIVELRYFGGLTVEETAQFLKMSHRTVEREWTAAKAWLYRELTEEQT
jgi:RNA polymerase sigma factor (TIGR02999 family)